MTTDLVAVKRVAEALGISVRAVQYRIAAGAIKAERFGDGPTAPYYVRRAELDRLLRERAETVGTP